MSDSCVRTKRSVSRGCVIDDIVRKYEPALLSFLSQHGTRRHDPEDLAQEVFVRLLKLPDLEDTGGIKTYLYRTARCVIVDEARKDKVRHGADHDEFDERAHGETSFCPERLLEGQQELDGVFHALDELPERTRDVFLLYNFRNLVQAEIADTLGIGLSTVELHLSKARKHLVNQA